MCIYVYTTLKQECDLFDLQWNKYRTWALHLQLPTGVPDPVVPFREAYENLKFSYPSLTKASYPVNCLNHPSPLFKIL